MSTPVDHDTDELAEGADEVAAVSVVEPATDPWLGVWLRRSGPADI